MVNEEQTEQQSWTEDPTAEARAAMGDNRVVSDLSKFKPAHIPPKPLVKPDAEESSESE
jgi:hypothetical protein